VSDLAAVPSGFCLVAVLQSIAPRSTFVSCVVVREGGLQHVRHAACLRLYPHRRAVRQIAPTRARAGSHRRTISSIAPRREGRSHRWRGGHAASRSRLARREIVSARKLSPPARLSAGSRPCPPLAQSAGADASHRLTIARSHQGVLGMPTVSRADQSGRYGIVCGPCGNTQSIASGPARRSVSRTEAARSSIGVKWAARISSGRRPPVLTSTLAFV
jgi:hypothetical protein